MLIKIQDNKYVTLHNKPIQNINNIVQVNIKDRDPKFTYKIGFNRHPLQDIKNGVVTLPSFTNDEIDVIIIVEISQMGKIVQTLKSDIYPLTLIPVIGRVLEESFPITLKAILDDNEKFKKDLMNKVDVFIGTIENKFKQYSDTIEVLENEGEIV